MNFDIAHLAADRALTQIELVGRARETAVLRSRHECNKAVDRRKLAPLQGSLRRNVKRYIVNEFSLSARCLCSLPNKPIFMAAWCRREF
jgi:hypothetical protein